MANPQLFKGARRGKTAPPADTVNRAGGAAYKRTSEEALAQIAATGCFGDTFYANAESQLEDLLRVAGECSPEFVAKAAIYARRSGYMKDMPAALLAHLAGRGPDGVRWMSAAFPHVVDNGRMVRNFVQMIRSGQFGRKSLGTAPQRAVKRWFEQAHPMQIFKASVGNAPSIVDVIKLARPKPVDNDQQAMYAYLLGKDHDVTRLPREVQHLEAWKRGERGKLVPRVPTRMLDGLELNKSDWQQVAWQARWMETRMNLAAWNRKGVFEDEQILEKVARRLRDPKQIKEARAFPYQLLQAWKMTRDVPAAIQDALQDAVDISLDNVPSIEGNLFICPDTSGSMSCGHVTGQRNIGRAGQNAATCLDVAAMFTAALLKKNPDAQVLPFAHILHKTRLNSRDSVMTLTTQLRNLGGGGTACYLPLAYLNENLKTRANVDVVIFISDSQSWISNQHGCYGAPQVGGHSPTAMAAEWSNLKSRNPRAKLVCIDLTPTLDKQVQTRPEVLQVGGFSDAVFDVVAKFAQGPDVSWVDEIDHVEFG